MRPKHRNMEEFAQASGVSRPTLSKYFDDPASVRPATRARIEAALRASDYRPNPFARNLNRKRTKTVGVVVPSIIDPHYSGLVSRIETLCVEAGYWPLVISCHGSAELEARAFDAVLSQKVAGALVAPLGAPANARLAEELGREVPLVSFDNVGEADAPFVGNDNRQSVATIVDYLCRAGEPPAFFDMPAVNRNAAERRAAYADTMARLGHEPVFLGSREGLSWDFERHGFEEMEKLLTAGRRPPRTILCANDRVAFGAMAAAHARGLRIGRGREADLALAGHDDHPLSRYSCPALTTMAQDTGAIATRSTAMLFALIDGGLDSAERRAIVEARLVMRRSA
ncbi:LacI family DNA-binding transcriptional regulator [Aureimonas leprariae]|uniref:LacI family transcriptional regulator n=1 Tax=Plantimonas leprariae TaxID=2615207 RepID=A0A7V7PTB0_9HYPH|nr:LacI family DNA-binding transcriptional regulator [Aureimonas leprariae]KAB0682945.1 LacI family transcriptional regulator [Aureimonas leprariae]